MTADSRRYAAMQPHVGYGATRNCSSKKDDCEGFGGSAASAPGGRSFVLHVRSYYVRRPS